MTAFRLSGGLFPALVLVVLMTLLALFGPLLYCAHSPLEMNVTARLLPPGGAYPLGTDEFGRDVLARILYGSRISMGVGFATAFCASLFGLALGVSAGYYRRVGRVVMRICDGLSAIPGILLAIALMTALGSSVWNVIIALTIVYTPGIARVVRSGVLPVKNAAYIEAAVVQGAGDMRIILRHIVPNVLSILLVQAAFVFAQAILSEAALSFLGAGIPPPEPSWGALLQSGKQVISKAWWMIVFPGCMVALAVLSLNLLGDALRDMLDPHTAREKAE